MKNSSILLKAGTREGRLALTQTRRALDSIEALVAGVRFERVPYSSPGDRDRKTDLRESAADFFTWDLDKAVRAGEIDLAIHSAKDCPDPTPEGLDWVWLPWREDPRDAWVLPKGKGLADLRPNARIGVSSDRRVAYARSQFPDAQMRPIRGNIEDRIAQLDRGDFDAILMAAAALVRLDLQERLTDFISLEALPVPEGQGVLCMTFRKADKRVGAIRDLFVRSVAFVSAGVGSADLCTRAGIEALQRCDVCLHDALLDSTLLASLPLAARRIPVGKRAGTHAVPQRVTTGLILDEVRKGRRVVRLKGGDATVLGRLAEEVAALDARALPFRVVPGVSSLSVAASTTGILLTRRGVSPGFVVMSARREGGGLANVDCAARSALPCAFFMGTKVIADLVAQLKREKRPGHTPAAVVYGAGTGDDVVVRSTLEQIADDAAGALHGRGKNLPGLFIVGEVARYAFNPYRGALQGKRVALTSSVRLLPRAVRAVTDLGGAPVSLPLIAFKASEQAEARVKRIAEYDWLVLGSPSAVEILFELMARCRVDVRRLPKVAVSGPLTAGALSQHGVWADVVPERHYGCDGILTACRPKMVAGERVLRLRSDLAGSALADALREAGMTVTDSIFYRTQPGAVEHLPPFDAIFFASGSAVRVFKEKWGLGALVERQVVAIGPPTRKVLQREGIDDVIQPETATVSAAMMALAGVDVSKRLKGADHE